MEQQLAYRILPLTWKLVSFFYMRDLFQISLLYIMLECVNWLVAAKSSFLFGAAACLEFCLIRGNWSGFYWWFVSVSDIVTFFYLKQTICSNWLETKFTRSNKEKRKKRRKLQSDWVMRSSVKALSICSRSLHTTFYILRMWKKFRKSESWRMKSCSARAGLWKVKSWELLVVWAKLWNIESFTGIKFYVPLVSRHSPLAVSLAMHFHYNVTPQWNF